MIPARPRSRAGIFRKGWNPGALGVAPRPLLFVIYLVLDTRFPT